MFFYLSFLRPPPVHANVGSDIEFTPQIANDLRTELFKTPIDIHYSFVSADFVHSTRLLKLTTWHPEQSAYKVLSILPPPSSLLQYSREWRIMLSCPHPKAGTETAKLNNGGCISLDDEEIGAVPLPVFSLPIRFEMAGPSAAFSQKTRGKSSKGKGKYVGSTKVQKQEGVQRVLVMERPLRNEREHIKGHTNSEERDEKVVQYRVLISEKTSFDLDKKIWDSGLGLSAWFARKLVSYKPIAYEEETVTVDPAYRVIEALSQSQCRILELGTGSGLVSLTLACVLSSQRKDESFKNTPGPSILATDLPSAVELIEQNLDANQRIWEAVDAKAGVLDWDNNDLPKEVIDAPPDVLLMADVTYNTSSFPSLLRTVNSILRLAPSCQVVLAYKERHEAEGGIWGMFEGVGLRMQKIDKVHGFGGAEVEVWLGGVDRVIR